MKGQITVLHLLQTISNILIAVVLLFGFIFLTLYLFKINWFNSKLAANTFASSISALSSSSYNLTLSLKIPENYKVELKGENVTVWIDSENYTAKIIHPSYIHLKESSSNGDQLKIIKVNDEVWIE